MNRLVQTLKSKVKPIVLAMVHLRALPGSPKNQLSLSKITDVALKEAAVYASHGVDGLIIENMHDVPYLLSPNLGPETISSMTVVCHEIRKAHRNLPLGIQMLSGGNKEALAVALCTDLDFIRAECFIYSHIADEGLMNSCAGDLMRYRNSLNAEHISVLTDIKKKHSSHSITADIDIVQMSKDAEFFLSDGVIITGNTTGNPADIDQVKAVRKGVSIPVAIGSGVTTENMKIYSYADVLIVGSHFKNEGKWYNEICSTKVQQLITERDRLRMQAA